MNKELKKDLIQYCSKYKVVDKVAITDLILLINKAIELQEDKLFTVEDIKKAIAFGLNGMYGYESGEEGTTKNQMKRFIQSLQQPTEIEVDIRCYIGNGDKESDSFKEPLVTNTGIPKLDENDCLILKKK